MTKYLLVALVLSVALGCSSRGKGPGASIDLLQNEGDQPLIEQQDQQVGTMNDKDINEMSDMGELNPVFFHYDRFDITEDQLPTLNSNARLVVDRGLTRIRIEGHCDGRGTEEYNLALGDRRARAAKDHLVSLGVEPDRIQTMSFGESRPFEQGQDENAWRLNRRAHFVVPQ